MFSVRFFQFVLYTYDTGQMSDSIHLYSSNLQSLVFLVNSHSPLLCFGSTCARPFFSLSYKVILPNSFEIIH